VCVALSIQQAMRMRHIVICSLSTSTIFSTSHKQNDLREVGGGKREKKKEEEEVIEQKFVF